MSAALDRIVHAIVADRVASCVSGGVWRDETRLWPHQENTKNFDLASLTKPLLTGGLLDAFATRGWLRPDDELNAYLATNANKAFDGMTLATLRDHEAGLKPWLPLYELAGDDGALRPRRYAPLAAPIVLAHVAAHGLAPDQRGRPCYSDLGYMLLWFALENVFLTRARGEAHSLYGWWQTNSAAPAGASEIFSPAFAPRGFTAALLDEIAPASFRAELGEHLCGDVDDDNCFALGGLHGHAGLFGTAEAVARLTRQLVQTANENSWGAGNGEFRHGWAVPTGPATSAGENHPLRAVGHLGFTGTCVWHDPDSDVTAVLLTNRVVYGRTRPERIAAARRAFFTAAWELAHA